MENTFKEDLQIVKTKSIDKLAKLDKMLKKINNTVCRGEVNIVDKDRNILVQTHYEYFKISILDDIIIISRYNLQTEMTTLDYTHIHTNNITEYSITSQALTLQGKLNEDTIINILAVLQ